MSRYLSSLVILLVACESDKISPLQIENIEIQAESQIQTSSFLTCIVQASGKGEPTVSIEWRNQNTGEVLGNEANLQLHPDVVSPNDLVECKVTVEDGEAVVGDVGNDHLLSYD